MAENRQLGIYWGDDILYFVETVDGGPQQVFQVPFTEEAKGSLEAGPMSPAGMELTSLIQKACRRQKINTSLSANLSLPTRDIIFRSFVIPWMQPTEIGGVVEFEAGKYLPFALEELSYAYCPVTVMEGNARRIRIIFVAIRKGVLGNYAKVLEQAALSVNVMEPGPLSLIRALVFKNHIEKNQTIALIEKGEETGRIIVLDQGVPQFVREFQLRIPTADREIIDPESLMTRLTNEIRISLNYFNRQEEYLKIKKIVFLSPTVDEEMRHKLEEDLRMPLAFIDSGSILNNAASSDMDSLKAYGAALINSAALGVDFDFSGGKPRVVKVAAASVKIPVNYKSIIKTALVCVPLIVSIPLLSKFLIQRQENKIAALTSNLSASQNISVSKLQQDNQALKDKLEHFREIHTGSDISAFLAIIPTLLPEGIWIDQLIITYSDTMSEEDKGGRQPPAGQTPGPRGGDSKKAFSKPVIEIGGVAYMEDPNEQFKLVNELLMRFKGNKELLDSFEQIELITTKAQRLGNYPVTSFQLRCQ